MTRTPLSIVKERFGDKAKLVEALEQFTGEDLWLGRTSREKGLRNVSNAKLLRLHRIFTEVKERFGTREKLVLAILELEKRTGDAGYKTRLSAYPVPRLLDLHRSIVRRQKRGAAGPRAARAATPTRATTAKKTAKKT